MSTASKPFPTWAFLSLAANGLLILTLILFLLREHWLPASSQASDPTTLEMPKLSISTYPITKRLTPKLSLGPRHYLNYQQWVSLLEKEAKAVAAQQPQHLAVLAGDSLSLWFPPEFLPKKQYWLNQGISGETTAGLLKRLQFFDNTQPDAIFIMIGINDLIRGVKEEEILANQKSIINYLRRVHPHTQIIVQSILPHSGENATWEGRRRLLEIPNQRIQKINQQLEAIATAAGASYINLYPLFLNEQGDLRSELSTDGLHLSTQGYLVWRAALQIFTQLKLEPRLGREQARGNREQGKELALNID